MTKAEMSSTTKEISTTTTTTTTTMMMMTLLMMVVVISPMVTGEKQTGSAPKISGGSYVLPVLPYKYLCIPCDTTGNPSPWVEWTRDGEPIHKFGDRFSVNKDSMSLRIFRIKIGDDGNYTCTAKNQHGFDSVTITVVVNYEPEVVITDPEPYTVLELTNHTLTCRSKGRPIPSIQWFSNRHREITTESQNARMFVEKRNISDKMSESVLYLNPVLDQDLGDFTCVATNLVSTQRVSVKIDVNFPPKAVSDYDTSIPIDWWEGHLPTLTCVTEGNELPNITWTYNDMDIQSQQGFITERMGYRVKSMYTLPRRSTANNISGRYVCTAHNSLGSAIIHEFNVRRVYPPPPVQSQAMVIRGNDVELSVKVARQPDTPRPSYVFANYTLADNKGPTLEAIADFNEAGEATLLLRGVYLKRAYVVSLVASSVVGLGDVTEMVIFTEMPTTTVPTTTSSTSNTKSDESIIDSDNRYTMPNENNDDYDEDEAAGTATAYGVKGGRNIASTVYVVCWTLVCLCLFSSTVAAV